MAGEVRGHVEPEAELGGVVVVEPGAAAGVAKRWHDGHAEAGSDEDEIKPEIGLDHAPFASHSSCEDGAHARVLSEASTLVGGSEMEAVDYALGYGCDDDDDDHMADDEVDDVEDEADVVIDDGAYGARVVEHNGFEKGDADDAAATAIRSWAITRESL